MGTIILVIVVATIMVAFWGVWFIAGWIERMFGEGGQDD